MAVILAFRVAIVLTPATIAAYRIIQGPATARLDGALHSLRDRLVDPDEDDVDLSVAMSEAVGDTVNVTTYSGDFEVRRVQLAWTVGTASMLDEDVRVCTFHLIKLSGPTPVNVWDPADFTAARDLFLAFWGSLKEDYVTSTKLASIKFYKDGPAILPPQPPVHAHELAPAVSGLSGNPQLPPQTAVSITEKTSVRRSWGRVYLPAMASIKQDPGAVGMLSPEGRIPDLICNEIADIADTLYQGLKTANLPAVVYRKALPEREDVNGTVLPERPATALSVDAVQVDNLFDVIRSRRYDKPSLRVQRDIT